MTMGLAASTICFAALTACGDDGDDDGLGGFGGLVDPAGGTDAGTGGTDGDGGTDMGLGGGGPSADCLAYCDEWVEIGCGTVVESADFEDIGDCYTACSAFPMDGETGDMEGDTVQCRITHLGLALDDKDTHCPHAAPDSTAFCVE